MAWTTEEHLKNLLRHIELVREAGVLLGERLMAKGRVDFGRLLIAKCHIHDASKFYGIEWDYLHIGPDVESQNLQRAVTQHVETNDHHPEYWGGISEMPEIAVAEMVCDWYARSQEFGTGLLNWVLTEAVQRYKIDDDSDQNKWIMRFIDLLFERSFK